MSRPRKLLVYLDQNFVSEMAKLGMNSKVRPEFETLFNVLHGGFLEEKIVALRSRFHEVESSLSGHLRATIRGCQSTLGHVRLRPPNHVKKKQMGRALRRYLKHNEAGIICHADALMDDADQRVAHLDIDVEMDWRFAGARQQREELASRLDTLRQSIAARAITYDAQHCVELAGEREIALSPMNTAMVGAQGCSPESWHEFVGSEDFAAVPHIRLETSLMSMLLTRHPERRVKCGDMTDLDAMSTYLPYCDVYATDAFAAALGRATRAEALFGCRIFDAKREGVRQLVEYITTTLADVHPVNVPSLSIFVTADASIKERSFDFFRIIGRQAKDAELEGCWVEVFGFDDGATSRYRFSGIDATAPFFGLQEVTSLRCQSSDPPELIIAACRASCRSDRFVLVNSYRDLPQGFMRQALLAAETGAADVYGYTIYSRKLN
jgi:hypothetical protein